ncbi:MAG: hypothetical protein ACOX0Z_00210 [Candidatus Nanosyncoccaceae bacterium]
MKKSLLDKAVEIVAQKTGYYYNNSRLLFLNENFQPELPMNRVTMATFKVYSQEATIQAIVVNDNDGKTWLILDVSQEELESLFEEGYVVRSGICTCSEINTRHGHNGRTFIEPEIESLVWQALIKARARAYREQK